MGPHSSNVQPRRRAPRTPAPASAERGVVAGRSMNADPLLRAAAIGQFSVALACGTTTFVQRPTSIIDGSPRMRVVVTGSALRARRPCDVYAIRAGSPVLLWCWGSGTSRRRRTMLRQCMGRTWVTVWDTVVAARQGAPAAATLDPFRWPLCPAPADVAKYQRRGVHL